MDSSGMRFFGIWGLYQGANEWLKSRRGTLQLWGWWRQLGLACTAATGMVSQAYPNDVTADGSRKMNSAL